MRRRFRSCCGASSTPSGPARRSTRSLSATASSSRTSSAGTASAGSPLGSASPSRCARPRRRASRAPRRKAGATARPPKLRGRSPNSSDAKLSELGLRPQTLQYLLQHLLLDRDVERAGRLVEHHHLRLHDQGARDGDALALAAGELVRVAGEQRLGVPAFGEPDVVERLHDAAAPLGGIELRRVDLEPLADDRLDGEPRRERRQRILKHYLDLAAQRALLSPVCLRPLHAVDADMALSFQKTENSKSERRFARARFADDA